MYEHKSKPLLSKKEFSKRMFVHVLVALLLVALTIVVGTIGHVYFDNMGVVVALVASITLTGGLGISILPKTSSGLLFASLYGIVSSYVYIATSSIVLAPILHRLFHKFHLESNQ